MKQKTMGLSLLGLLILFSGAASVPLHAADQGETFASTLTIPHKLSFDDVVPATETNKHSSEQEGLRVGDVRFVGETTGFGYETWVMTKRYDPDASYVVNGSDCLVGGRQKLTLYLPAGTTAIGFLLGKNHVADGNTVKVSLKLRGKSEPVFKEAVSLTNEGEFVSYQDATEIEQVQIISDTPAGLIPYIMLDNLVYGKAKLAATVTVPIPQNTPTQPVPVPSVQPTVDSPAKILRSAFQDFSALYKHRDYSLNNGLDKLTTETELDDDATLKITSVSSWKENFYSRYEDQSVLAIPLETVSEISEIERDDPEKGTWKFAIRTKNGARIFKWKSTRTHISLSVIDKKETSRTIDDSSDVDLESDTFNGKGKKTTQDMRDAFKRMVDAAK